MTNLARIRYRSTSTHLPYRIVYVHVYVLNSNPVKPLWPVTGSRRRRWDNPSERTFGDGSPVVLRHLDGLIPSPRTAYCVVY